MHATATASASSRGTGRDRPAGPILPAGLMFLSLVCACADAPHRSGSDGEGDLLGDVHFPVSCSDGAGTAFDRAVALLHHMTYPEARAAFRRVSRIDSSCAMAHWGVAMTLFHPLWPTRPDADERRRGWEAAQRAVALDPPTEEERLFVRAVEAFFRDPASEDYWARIRRWEAAMEEVYRASPGDPEAATFYALAHLATAPSDRVSRTHADSAAAILLRVLERKPDHPGAMHYLVHANDMPGRERLSLDVVRRYQDVAPENPHALHMPTHIFTRLGDWDAVIAGNVRAARAALAHPAGEQGELVWDEFPHAIEYLVYAYLQEGADDSALAALRRLRGTPDLQPTFKTAFHLASTEARYALERRDWPRAAAIAPREPPGLDWDRYRWPEAVAQFARGLGAAHLGTLADAHRAARRLADLEARSAETGETLFAASIRMLGLELRGWIAHAEHDPSGSVALMREAADLERSTPKHAVTPAPTLPAEELLGDLYLEDEEAAQALSAYRRSLERYPRRFNSLLGAARAARALGDAETARSFYGQLLDSTTPRADRPALAEARRFVTNGG